MIDIQSQLGSEAETLLGHTCAGIPKENLHLPGSDYVDRVVARKNRKPGVLRNLNALYLNGRLSGTGYLSILPVDQASNILPVHPLHQTRRFLILPISSNWQWKGDVMRLFRPWVS